MVRGARSAAALHRDDSHRAVYCVESPESWFENFGKAQLANGTASVKLDPSFAAIVHADDYHVFLTEYGGHIDLFVDELTANGFEVRTKGGAGSGAFSWRIVAKRKDIKGERLAKVNLPKPEASRKP